MALNRTRLSVRGLLFVNEERTFDIETTVPELVTNVA
jgi:hypothetical protein